MALTGIAAPTAMQALATALEAAVGVLLGIYAISLATNRRARTTASRLLAALCAIVAVIMGCNLLRQFVSWPLLIDAGLAGDLLAAPLILGLVQHGRDTQAPLDGWAAFHCLPALFGLTLWKSGLVQSMDGYVIACWACYLGVAAWLFLRHLSAYGSTATRRLLAILLAVAAVVLGLRVLLARSTTAQAPFLASPFYILVLGVCLAVACAMLFSALNASGRGRAWGAGTAAARVDVAELKSVDARLQSALTARIFLDPHLTLERLAEALDAPPRLVSHLINEKHGVNVKTLLNQRRVAIAAGLLRDQPDRPIKTIMYDFGFVSRSQFNEAFQRQLGLSPSAYRQKTLG